MLIFFETPCANFLLNNINELTYYSRLTNLLHNGIFNHFKNSTIDVWNIFSINTFIFIVCISNRIEFELIQKFYNLWHTFIFSNLKVFDKNSRKSHYFYILHIYIFILLLRFLKNQNNKSILSNEINKQYI